MTIVTTPVHDPLKCFIHAAHFKTSFLLLLLSIPLDRRLQELARENGQVMEK
jgi:hypothetical protein